MHRVNAVGGGVVDQHVDAAERLTGSLRHSRDVLLAGDVAIETQAFAAECANVRPRRFHLGG